MTGDAVKIHASYGFTTDSDVERYYRDAEITAIYEDTSNVQTNLVVGHLRR